MTKEEKDKLEELFLAYGNKRWEEAAYPMKYKSINNCLSNSTKIYGKFLELLGNTK